MGFDEEYGARGQEVSLRLTGMRRLATDRSWRSSPRRQPPGYIAPVDPREGLPHYGA